MNVKMPKGVKMPSIVINVSGESASKPLDYSKRLDSLESKLDDQYKAFINKKDKKKEDARLYKTMLAKMERMSDLNKAYMAKLGKPKIVVNTPASKSPTVSFRGLENKLSELEKSIKNFKPTVRVIRSGGNSNLSKSLEVALERMQRAIERNRPLLTPRPT